VEEILGSSDGLKILESVRDACAASRLVGGN